MAQPRQKLDLKPIEEDELDLQPLDLQPEEPQLDLQPQEGIISRGWRMLSEPLTDLPSRAARAVSDKVSGLRRTTDNPLLAGFIGAVEGGLEGLGDVVTDFTSPINLATAAATGGSSVAAKRGLTTIANTLGRTGQAAGALTAGSGVEQMIDPESTLSERAMGLAQTAGGIAGMKSRIPQIGKATIPPKSAIPTNMPDMNLATKITIKNATPENIKKAGEMGYTFSQVTDKGFEMVRTKTPGQQMPILESEIGTSRATPGAARDQLGQLVDKKSSNPLIEAYNFPRGVMASMDFSAPLRQGLPLIHKKEFWNAFGSMFKSWGSEEAFQAVQKSISDRPLFRPRANVAGKKPLPSFAEEAGLKLSDLTDLTKREEAIMSTWAEKVPGVRRSNRAYTAFLNKLRADTFEDLINKGKVFGADADVNAPLARGLADFVNTATGRGSLGRLERNAVALNSTFFSPRLIASRLKLLNPMYYYKADPMVRKEALKSLFAVASTGTLLAELSKMGGGEVENDPTSSDFRKIKIGNTRIDPYGGFQQYIVAANRLLQGRIKSSTSGREYNLGEEFGRPTRLDTLGRFAEGKLHPVLTFATGLLRGKDFTGQPFNVPQEAASRFIPILIQDIYELAQEDPNLLPLVIPASLGMGIQNYK